MAVPGETGAFLLESSETSLAQSIRQKHADILRSNLEAGRVVNKLWGAALMAKECGKELEDHGLSSDANLLNMAIGDIDWRKFEGHTGRLVAERLGLAPDSERQLEIERRKQEIRRLHAQVTTDSIWRYQETSLGYEPLRARFANYIQEFGLPIGVEHTVLSPGSFIGVDNVWGALYAWARQTNRPMDIVFPVPGFTVVATQAERRGIRVHRVQTEEANEYCVTDTEMAGTLGIRTDDMTVLYLTPMQNPASTVVRPDMMKAAMETFLRFRPNGKILIDLAYLDMIDRNQALAIMDTFKDAVLQASIFSVSMSKMFCYTRLRMAALHSVNREILQAMSAQWQTVFASLPGPAEIEAEAIWELVGQKDRQAAYDIFRARQRATIERLARINEDCVTRGSPPITELSNVHSAIPLYLFLKLNPKYDFLSAFVESGLLGLPGDVFGDTPTHNMLRISMGIEPIAYGPPET